MKILLIITSLMTIFPIKSMDFCTYQKGSEQRIASALEELKSKFFVTGLNESDFLSIINHPDLEENYSTLASFAREYEDTIIDLAVQASDKMISMNNFQLKSIIASLSLIKEVTIDEDVSKKIDQLIEALNNML